jgi:hypothetical protein
MGADNTTEKLGLKKVAVGNRHVVTERGEGLLQLRGDRHGAVPPTRASDADADVTALFTLE